VPINFCASREGPLASPEKPLHGKRIVLTRAPEQAREWTQALEEMGAEVILLPAVTFFPAEPSGALDTALGSLSEFDWILFTSQNAVRFFSRRLKQLGLSLRPADSAGPPDGSARPCIAAVGPATAQAAAEAGFHVDYIAAHHSGESLARELFDSLAGRKILLPRSDRADDRLPTALRNSGAQTTEVVAYRTAAPGSLDPGILDRLRRAEVDAIVFASPSAYHNLSALMGSADTAALSAQVQFVAIGPTTARTLRETGARVALEAGEGASGAAALAASIAALYARDHVAAGKRAAQNQRE